METVPQRCSGARVIWCRSSTSVLLPSVALKPGFSLLVPSEMAFLTRFVCELKLIFLPEPSGWRNPFPAIELKLSRLQLICLGAIRHSIKPCGAYTPPFHALIRSISAHLLRLKSPPCETPPVC